MGAAEYEGGLAGRAVFHFSEGAPAAVDVRGGSCPEHPMTNVSFHTDAMTELLVRIEPATLGRRRVGGPGSVPGAARRAYDGRASSSAKSSLSSTGR